MHSSQVVFRLSASPLSSKPGRFPSPLRRTIVSVLQEIVSGAQRIHELPLLIERATAKGIPLEGIASYLAAFKHGAEPHGG